jgi:hypothetical protein
MVFQIDRCWQQTRARPEYQIIQTRLNPASASPGEIVSMLLDGQADIGIATEAAEDT